MVNNRENKVKFTADQSSEVIFQAYDQKNIRRRVYDALNVLMAMNIISKEKKEIRWIGLPTNSAQECQNLELLFLLFTIHDDIEVLKRMGMALGLEKGQCPSSDLARAVKMVPKSLEPYVIDSLE
ncbi:hypothetical protein KUTeg_012239 [Tegillarca granosa]|uniref:Uncharacterized protein n=1 Tax=Tegillarca granosa TaxID=220873 RepID=A0ABQ9EYX7_TEGGR|nr:hypothetical protein KUTeg_012239 [Tegillarca granosa]